MLKKRLIPCLFLKDGFLVRSEQFKTHQILGDALHQVSRFNEWAVDELIYIDISRGGSASTGRQDLRNKHEENSLQLLECIAKTCLMPLTFGGGIRTLEDIAARLSRGADKITLNTQALIDPTFITTAAQQFGSQALVISIDVKQHASGQYEVFSHHGQQPTGKTPLDWAKTVETLGAGEIFLNSIDRDGMGEGYDISLIRQIADTVGIPLIACGGVGDVSDFAAGLREGHADAVAAGNFFHFTELSAKKARKALLKEGLNVRKLV